MKNQNKENIQLKANYPGRKGEERATFDYNKKLFERP